MIYITEQEFLNMDNDGGGFCLSCGDEAWGVEPDARNYTCETCGATEVYGASELLMMGEISFE